MAKNILSDVKAEHLFWISDGTAIKNLHELAGAMGRISDDVFRHHVNDQRNDFHNWVRDVHKDKKLADSLLKSKTKEETTDCIMARLHEIENKKEIKTKNELENKTEIKNKKEIEIKKKENKKKISLNHLKKKQPAKIKATHKKKNKIKKEKKNEFVEIENDIKNNIIEDNIIDIQTGQNAIQEQMQVSDNPYTISGTIIALVTLIISVVILKFINKPAITGAVVKDVPASQNWIIVISVMAVIGAVAFLLKTKKVSI